MNLNLDRRNSTYIKAFALMLMFVHHFFTFPGWYVPGVSYPSLKNFAQLFTVPSQTCVLIFAFLTGYLYQINHKHSYGYSLRKIAVIYISYWVVLIPFTVLAVCLGDYTFTLSGFLQELLAMKYDIMVFCWYVAFYAGMMLLLPLLNKILTHSFLLDFAITYGITLIIRLAGHFVPAGPLATWLSYLSGWGNYVFMGYLTAKYDLFGKLCDGLLFGGLNKYLKWFICLLTVIVSMLSYNFRIFASLNTAKFPGLPEIPITSITSLLVAVLYLYSLGIVLQAVRGKWLDRILTEVGSKSMAMWFTHCLFFNVCRFHTQKLLYLPRNPVLVFLWGLLLCYAGAWVFDRAAKEICRRIPWLQTKTC